MSQFVIREAIDATDIATVRALMAEYGDYLAANPAGAAKICIQGYREELESLPGHYAAPGGAMLLAESSEGHPLGCVALKPIQARHAGERACELKRLWVRPEARGLGLGRALMLAAIASARKLGYDALYLDTVPAAMPEANALYARLGFVEVPRYNENAVPGIVFFRRDLALPLV